MFLALAVLLLQPSTVPVPTVTKLPIQITNYSLSIISEKQIAADQELPDAESPSFSFLPGQTEPTSMSSTGESSSRLDSESMPGNISAYRRASSYRPPVETAGGGVPKMWYILGALEHGGATFDAWTTRRMITSGTGRELNPMLRPFANSGGLYAAVQVAPFLFDLLAKHMLHSSHGWERRIWWLPQSASAAASFASGAHNLAIH
jgi:hypothetical protein